MPFRAPFGTNVYVRNRLGIADSIPLLAGTDSFLDTTDLHLRSIPESAIYEFIGSRDPWVHDTWKMFRNFGFWEQQQSIHPASLDQP